MNERTLNRRMLPSCPNCGGNYTCYYTQKNKYIQSIIFINDRACFIFHEFVCINDININISTLDDYCYITQNDSGDHKTFVFTSKDFLEDLKQMWNMKYLIKYGYYLELINRWYF